MSSSRDEKRQNILTTKASFDSAQDRRNEEGTKRKKGYFVFSNFRVFVVALLLQDSAEITEEIKYHTGIVNREECVIRGRIIVSTRKPPHPSPLPQLGGEGGVRGSASPILFRDD
jgi:hypothetical protein